MRIRSLSLVLALLLGLASCSKEETAPTPARTNAGEGRASAEATTSAPDEVALVRLPASSTAFEGAPEEDDEVLVLEVTRDTRESPAMVLHLGEPLSFPELGLLLETHGVRGNPEPDDDRLSRSRLLIRCDRDQSFDYVKLIFHLCARPDTAIYKTSLAVLNGSSREGWIDSWLPTEYDLELEEEPEEFEDPVAIDGEESTPERPRRVTIKLRQPTKDAVADWRSADRTMIWLDDKRLGETPEAGLALLRAKLRAVRSVAPDARARIETGLGVPHRRVVEALDILIEQQFENVAFVGMAPGSRIDAAFWNDLRERLGGR